MAQTVVQIKEVGSTSSGTVAMASNVTAGNAIIAFSAGFDGLSGGITDTPGNTYNSVTSVFDGSRTFGGVWLATNILGGACTLTFSGPASVNTFVVYEVSGADPADTLEASGTDSAKTSLSASLVLAAAGAFYSFYNNFFSGGFSAFGPSVTTDGQDGAAVAAWGSRLSAAANTYSSTASCSDTRCIFVTIALNDTPVVGHPTARRFMNSRDARSVRLRPTEIGREGVIVSRQFDRVGSIYAPSRRLVRAA